MPVILYFTGRFILKEKGFKAMWLNYDEANLGLGCGNLVAFGKRARIKLMLLLKNGRNI